MLTARRGFAAALRLLSVLLLSQLCGGCLTGTWSMIRSNTHWKSPTPVVASGRSADGALVVELENVLDTTPRRGRIVLAAAEIEAALAGAPVESKYRISVPHVSLARERLFAPARPEGELTPVIELAWKPYARDAGSTKEAAPRPLHEPDALAFAWTRVYRTGSEKEQEALFVAESGPRGERRAVFVFAPYSPRSWDLALTTLLTCADVVLIASLF